MGGPISSIVADIVLNHLEREIISKFPYKICFYRRYVDDCLLACNEEDITTIVEEFNSAYNRIKFTVEKEHNNQINFLDITIYNRGETMDTSWYTKPIWSQRYTNYHSCVPKNCKIGVVYSLLDRAVMLSDQIFHQKNINKVRETLKINDYPTDFINKYINKRLNKYKHKNTNNTTNSQNSHENKLYKSFTYLPHITDMVRYNFLMKTNKIISPRRYNTLMNLLFTKLKAPTPNEIKSNLVYKISCSD